MSNTPRHTPRRLLRGLAVVMIAGVQPIGLATSPALADATGGHQAVHFALTCGGEHFTVVSPSEPSAAVQLADGTSVLIGTDALLITTYTDPQTGQVVSSTQHFVYGAGHGNAHGTQDRVATCTHTDVLDDPDVGPITVDLVGQFILAPPS